MRAMALLDRTNGTVRLRVHFSFLLAIRFSEYRCPTHPDAEQVAVSRVSSSAGQSVIQQVGHAKRYTMKPFVDIERDK